MTWQWVSGTGETLPLDGSTGAKILRGARGLDLPQVHNVIDQRVGTGGAVLVSQRLSERPLEFPVIIDSEALSPADVMRLFFRPGSIVSDAGRVLREVIYDSGGEGRWTADMGGIQGLGHRKFLLSLLALDPHWYGALTSVSGVFDEPTAWNAEVSWEAAIPWNGGASMTVTVEGDEPAACRVVVLADADPVEEVSFSADGVGWRSAGFAAGEALTVDSRPGRRGPYLGSSLLGITERPRDWTLLSKAQRTPFLLTPGEVELSFGAVSDTPPQWWIWWEPRWLTPGEAA